MFNFFNRSLSPKAMEKIMARPEFKEYLRENGWLNPRSLEGFDQLHRLGWMHPAPQGGGGPSPPAPKGGGGPSPPAPK